MMMRAVSCLAGLVAVCSTDSTDTKVKRKSFMLITLHSVMKAGCLLQIQRC